MFLALCVFVCRCFLEITGADALQIGLSMLGVMCTANWHSTMNRLRCSHTAFASYTINQSKIALLFSKVGEMVLKYSHKASV